MSHVLSATAFEKEVISVLLQRKKKKKKNSDTKRYVKLPKPSQLRVIDVGNKPKLADF